MRMSVPLLLMLSWSAVGVLRAEEAVVVSVRCLGREIAAAEASAPPSALHVFGGSTLTFLVAVEAPLGTRLRVQADLLQTAAGTLAVPVQSDVTVSGELVFETRTHLTTTCTLPGLPAVQRPTRMLLKLRGVAREHADPPSPAVVEVWTYPQENPDEWEKTIAAALAQSGMTRLEVFGQGSRLRRFFKERRVAFEDGGAEWFDAPDPRTLYVGDEPLPMPTRITSVEGLRLILFAPPGLSTPLPGVYQRTDSKGGLTVKVTLPDLLGHLAGDPRCQQTLAAILRQSLTSQSAAASNPASNQNSP